MEQPKIETEEQNDSLIAQLEALHDRDNLSAEEEVWAERVTAAIETFEEEHYAFQAKMDIADAQDLPIVPRPPNTKLSELYKDQAFRDCLKRGWLAERIANLHLLTKHQASDVLQELAQGLRDGSVTLDCQSYEAEPFWRGVWRVMRNCLAWSAIALALTLFCWGVWHAFTRHQ